MVLRKKQRLEYHVISSGANDYLCQCVQTGKYPLLNLNGMFMPKTRIAKNELFG